MSTEATDGGAPAGEDALSETDANRLHEARQRIIDELGPEDPSRAEQEPLVGENIKSSTEYFVAMSGGTSYNVLLASWNLKL